MAVLARLLGAPIKNISTYAKKTDTAVVCINQIRSTMAMYGPSTTTPGGSAMKYYASLRLELKQVDKIKKGADEIIGQIVRVKTIKNKVGMPYKTTEFNLIYGQGISLLHEIVDVALEKQVIKRAGAWYTYPIKNGETLRCQGRDPIYDYYKTSQEDLDYLHSLIKSSNQVAKDILEAEEPEAVDEIEF